MRIGENSTSQTIGWCQCQIIQKFQLNHWMTPTLSNQCLASGVSPLVTECQKLTCTYVADTSLVGSADVGLRFILSVLPELLFVQTFPFLMNQCPHEQETLHLAEVPTGGLQDKHIHTLTHDNTWCAVVGNPGEGGATRLPCWVHLAHTQLLAHHQDGLTTLHWSPTHKVQRSEYTMQGSRYRVQGSWYRVQGSWCEPVQGT